MIRYVNGSIFDSGADILVCPVNCVGVMGAGLAREFAKRFPGIERQYKSICCTGWIRDYRTLIVQPVQEASEPSQWVALLATKDDWRDPSQPMLVYSGLAALAERLLTFEKVNASVAIPALGCGLGGLDWACVKPMIEGFCNAFPERQFFVYPPR